MRGNSGVYHFILREEKQTVCGLSVSELARRSGRSGALHRTLEPPPNARLCKHCARMSEGSLNSDPSGI